MMLLMVQVTGALVLMMKRVRLTTAAPHHAAMEESTPGEERRCKLAGAKMAKQELGHKAQLMMTTFPEGEVAAVVLATVALKRHEEDPGWSWLIGIG